MTYPCCRHCAESSDHVTPPEGHAFPCDRCPQLDPTEETT